MPDFSFCYSEKAKGHGDIMMCWGLDLKKGKVGILIFRKCTKERKASVADTVAPSTSLVTPVFSWWVQSTAAMVAGVQAIREPTTWAPIYQV